LAQHDHNDVDAPGNQPARPDWAALYQRHREAMLRVAASLLRQAGRDTGQAQDIVNQVFVEVMNKPPDPPGNWEAYLVKATAYRTKDHMTTADARRAVPVGTGTRDDEPVLLDRATDYDVEEQALCAVRAELLRHRVREVLAGLPDDQRRVVRLRLFDRMTNVEIAPLLDVTPQRVSQLWKAGWGTVWATVRDDPGLWLEDEQGDEG
jgi:RNA polymerase sigma factor (sigma-70 family)